MRKKIFTCIIIGLSLLGIVGAIQANLMDNGDIYDVGFGAFGTSNTYTELVDNASLIATSVPEPVTMILFGTGLVGLAGIRRRSQKNNSSKKNEYSLDE